MSDPRWGEDPEYRPSSSEVGDKILAFLFFAGSGGVPFAINFWLTDNGAFSPFMCALSAVSGATMLAIYCFKEKLPLWAALIAGPIAGMGTYAMTAMWVFDRDEFYYVELLAPILMGSIPGIVVFIICVRIHYAKTDV